MPGNKGPLKMGGLPGTILELETEDGFLNVKFDKIIFNLPEPILLDRITNKYDRKLTQKQSLTESKDAIENFTAKLKAKQPRDAKFEITFDEPLEKEYQ